MHMAALPFLLAMLQAQPPEVGWPVTPVPDAAAPARWTNSPTCLEHAVDFTDGSAVRVLVLNNLYDVYQGPSFAAGFYCAPPCDAFLFAVYIVYAESNGVVPHDGMVQVIWAANRGRPVRENATLSLTVAGGLVLRDADGSLVCSAGSSSKAAAGLTITRSGNLVLLDGNNVSVWESFHHPTDSIVPGQILASGMVLTPSMSITNFSADGQLRFTVQGSSLYAIAGSQVYYPNRVNTIIFSDANLRNDERSPDVVLFLNGSISAISSGNYNRLNPQGRHNSNSPHSLDPQQGPRILISLALPRSLQYMRFESDGHLRLYEWHDWQSGWVVVQDVLRLDACSYPTICGQYGLCDKGQCSCLLSERNTNLAYFRPIDNQKTNLGCMPLVPISCQSVQDHRLVAISNVSYFDFIWRTLAEPIVDEGSCKQACLHNCSCKAALFYYTKNTSAGSCFLLSQLFSFEFEVLQQDSLYFKFSAYIKVQLTHSPSGAPTPIGPSSGGNTVRVKKSSASIMIGVILGSVGGFIVLLLFITLLCKRRKRYEEIDEEGDLGELPGMPTRFTFEQLKVATEHFREKLGHGGFGSVYMGQLREERVAVKCLDRAGQGKREFLAEVQTIGYIHHINLVRLVGFCAEKSQRLLVYEYMSKGSLDRWIYYRHDNATLDWNTRRRIIADIAKGLCYLHEECRQRIAHLDVKPQNILLDDNFNAKLSDFGLAKLIDRDNSQVITKMRGTPGYLAPEWLTSQITEKVDIYSFGVVVMEVISGRKNLDSSEPEESVHLISLLQEKARSDQLVELIDKNSEDMQMHRQEAVGMIKLAMWCLQIDYNKRPRMSVVVHVLEGSIEVETNIDYTFIATVPVTLGNAGKTGSSAPHVASQLSGPR